MSIGLISTTCFYECALTSAQVVGEVQGPEDKVMKLMEDLNRGPQSAKVLRVEHERKTVTEGTDIDFEIRRKSSSAYR